MIQNTAQIIQMAVGGHHPIADGGSNLLQKVQVRFRFRPNAAEPFSKGSAMNKFGFSATPIYRKTWEVQFAAGGRKIAPIVPLIDARIFGNAHSS